METEVYVDTDESLVTPEMLRNMVSETTTDPNIPTQVVDFEPAEGMGDNHGDR